MTRNSLIVTAIAIVSFLLAGPTRGISLYVSLVCAVVAVALGIIAVGAKRETHEESRLPALAALTGSVLVLVLAGGAFVIVNMWAMH
jgi:hypothetical protein